MSFAMFSDLVFWERQIARYNFVTPFLDFLPDLPETRLRKDYAAVLMFQEHQFEFRSSVIA
jgi:hypothetical protein